MPEIIKIKGGNPLHGSAEPVPNKNAMLAALPACVLTDQTVIYRNLPRTTDVEKILEIIKKLGADVDDSDYSAVKINCKNINTYEVDKELGNLMRASIMFAGPLMARFGKAKIPLPGGCVLGKRSISGHIDAFKKAGCTIEVSDGYAYFEAPKEVKPVYDIWLMEASVTSTENLVSYAAGVDATFNITEAAGEPHVTQLLKLLEDMGAQVTGFESNKITIKGKKGLKGAEFVPEPDFVDIGGMIVATAITKGKVTIKNSNIPRIIGGMVQCFEKFNIGITGEGNDLVIDGTKDLHIDLQESGFPLAGEDLPKFSPRPWPGFPVDVLPVVVTLACKTKGRLLIQNWMYETGLDFIRELNALGANIFMADPQRIIVSGPVDFKGGKVISPSIIQACKAIFLSALPDPVETTIVGSDILKRRYPNIIDVYRGLGADIELIQK